MLWLVVKTKRTRQILSLVCFESFLMMCMLLLDPGASLSFVTPYVVVKFGICLEHHLEPFNVSTPLGESIFAKSP